MYDVLDEVLELCSS